MIKTKNLKIYLVVLAFLLFSITLVGLFWLGTTPGQTAGLSLSYAAGLSMIFLPCTLPLVFIIVPLSMGKEPRKGLMMALLFGLGLAVTLSLYGVFVAGIGKYLGLDKATRIMFGVAGAAALIFGFSELKLFTFKVLESTRAVPNWIQQKGGYLKSFFMGLFLGNAGVGCPNPAFYVLLTYIASTGSLSYGSWLGFIHGVGRATPLIFLAILGVLGVRATGWVSRQKAKIDKITGWALVGIGTWILAIGVFSHQFWMKSPLHKGWNEFIQSLGISSETMKGGGKFIIIPWIVVLVVIGLSVAWYFLKKRTEFSSKALAFFFLVLILLSFGGGFILQTKPWLKTTVPPKETVPAPVKKFEITARQWEFEPNKIVVNKGDRVRLKIKSVDVTHGFALDEFGVNKTLPPHQTVRVKFVADKKGEFTFYCSIYCGRGHYNQKGRLIVK